MLYCLSYQPYKDMAVEDHVFQFELLFVLVLVDEGGLKFTFLPYVEFLNFDLLCKVHSVLGHSFEDRFLRAPIDGELLVLLVVVQVLYLIL